jgi:4-amino-4-deoxy-L-arabinose transferase-like glycosyltransferase
MSSPIWEKLRPHWPFAILAAAALATMLLNLGSDYLWADEGDTAALGSNILKFGVPEAWDGMTFVDPDRGARLNQNLVMVTNPWLQYYVSAASFLIFGQNTFAARLPFALAGWVTILLVYRLVSKATQNRWAGLCSAAILVGSVQFLLYCRQCRYYALSMLLTTLLVQIFLQTRSLRQSAVFALVAILLFHTHPLAAGPVIALGLLTLIYRPFFSKRRAFWIAVPIIAAFTLPWIAFAGSGYAESMGSVETAAQFAGRLVQYLIECASVTPLIAAVVLFFVSAFRKRGNEEGGQFSANTPTTISGENHANALLFVVLATLLLNAPVIAATQPADSLWRIGIRYTAAMLPLTAMAVGILITKITGDRPLFSLAILVLVIFTKFGQLTPWIFWGKSVASFDGKEVIEAHLPSNIIERFLNTRQQLFFLRDLLQDNPGTIALASRFLRDNAKPGDRLITNYEWEPLYFHTHLPQALKILPDYPIQAAAKSKGLPPYVFDVDQVRWVIWRPIWDGYQGYFANDVQRQITDRGGTIERVAELPETLWENRENIHFRRFSGGRYLFHGPETFPAVSVFRISWPGVP